MADFPWIVDLGSSGTLTFSTAEELVAWLKAEVDFWSFVSGPYFKDILKPVTAFKSYLAPEGIVALQANSEEIKNQIGMYGAKSIYSKSLAGSFIGELRKTNPYGRGGGNCISPEPTSGSCR